MGVLQRVFREDTGFLRPWLAGNRIVVLLCVFIAISPLTAAAAQVWFVDQKTISQVDTETFSVVQSASLSDQAAAIAVDTRDKSIWVLSNTVIYKYDSSFGLQFSHDLTGLYRTATSSNAAFPSAEHLAIDPYDGAVWISAGKNILHLKDDGSVLQAWSADNIIDDIELGVDEYLWVLTSKNVVQLNKFGTVSNTFALDIAKQNPRYQSLDNLRSLLWLADKGQLQIYSLGNAGQPPSTFPVAGSGKFQPTGLTGDISKGNVWTADDSTLYQYNAAGELLVQVDLGTLGMKNPAALLWDPVGMVLWVGDDTHLAAFNSATQLLRVIPTKKLRAIATDNLVLQPFVELTSPAADSYINVKRPPLVFKVTATCNFIPCLDADLYADRVFLNVTLDDLSIGQGILPHGGMGAYTPVVDLAEGLHLVGGYGIDPFGHTSNILDSKFTVDTIPPVFQNVSPSDGSIILNNPVTLTGHVNDASPVQVTLKDSSDETIATGGIDFSFNLTLAPGLNVFELSAVDAAGNETKTALHFTLGEPLKISISRPLNGTFLGHGSVWVQGTFDGPSNTGVTVNGNVATTAGGTFAALLSLPESGSFEIRAVATSMGGSQAEDSVTVNIDAASVNSTVPEGMSLTVDQAPVGNVRLIDTVAGTGDSTFSGEGGPAIDASFVSPTDVVAAQDGTYYIVDDYAHRVQQVDTSGTIRTVAGSGPYGYSGRGYGGDGGPAVEAQFSTMRIDIGPDGTLYILDMDNYRVRHVSNSGIVTTVAGNGSRGFSGDSGPATAAALDPIAFTVGADGSIYIATAHNRIRKVDPSGIITTIAGTGSYGYSGDDGPATSAAISWINDLAVGPDGSLFVADSDNFRVRKIDPSGNISTVAGRGVWGPTGDGGSATSATIGWINSLRVDDSGGIYLSTDLSRIRYIDQNGTIHRIAGLGSLWGDSGYGYSGDGGLAEQALLNDPEALAITSNGDLVVADTGNRRIRKIFKPSEDSALINANIILKVPSNFGANVSVTKVEFDFESDGVTDQSYTTWISQYTPTHIYQGPGTFILTAKVTLSTGKIITLQEPVTILDKKALAETMVSLWSQMNNALIAGDLPRAETYLTIAGRDHYHQAFIDLKDKFPITIPTYSPLEPMSINPHFLEGAVVRNVGGQAYVFLIYLVPDENGIWRLDTM